MVYLDHFQLKCPYRPISYQETTKIIKAVKLTINIILDEFVLHVLKGGIVSIYS